MLPPLPARRAGLQVVAMVVAMVPGSTQLDADHFRSLLDIDGNEQISLPEFLSAMGENTQVAAAVSAVHLLAGKVLIRPHPGWSGG